MIKVGPGAYDNHVPEKWSKQSKFTKSPSFGCDGNFRSSERFKNMDGGSIAPSPDR